MEHFEAYKNNDDLSPEELDDLTKSLIQAKFDREKRANWAKQLEEKHSVRPFPSIVPQKKQRRWQSPIIAIAASLALLLVALVIWQPFQSQTDQLVASYTTENPFPNNLVRKGNSKAIPDLRLEAAETYVEGDYSSAASLYEQLRTSDKSTVEDALFLGLCQLYTQQYEAAVATFETAKPQSVVEDQFQQEINWFLALAYIQQDNISDARTQLEYIVSNKHWRHADAAKLLKTLER